MDKFGVPNTLDFSLKKNAISTANKQIVHTPLSGGTSTPGSTVQFGLATGTYGAYLDPTQTYLSFTIRNDDATPLVLDGSAYSFIDRITVQSSGGVISDLQRFAPWAQLMLDCSLGTVRPGACSAFMGTATDLNLNTLRSGASMAANSVLNVSIPLMGTCIDSTSSDKLIPVGGLSDLQLMIYLAGANEPIVSAVAGTPNWSLTNMALTCSYIHLDVGAQKMIDDEQDGVYKWSGETWRAYDAPSIVSGSTGDNVIVPIKASSVKSVMAIMRPVANMNNKAAFTNTSRYNPYARSTQSTQSSFFATVGSTTIPGIPIKNTSQHFCENLKMWHSLGQSAGLISSFDGPNFEREAIETMVSSLMVIGSAGAFYAGLNLEAYTNKSGTIHSGVNCSGSTQLVLNQTYAQATRAGMTQTTYCHIDAAYVVEDRVMVSITNA